MDRASDVRLVSQIVIAAVLTGLALFLLAAVVLGAVASKIMVIEPGPGW
jgi:hypothetical protein